MTDYFKTIRAYLRGKWGRKSRVADGRVNVLSEPGFGLILDADGHISGFRSFISGAPIMPWYEAHHRLATEIARLRRNKKKHSHLQKQLDDLLNGGAQISDQQTENTK